MTQHYEVMGPFPVKHTKSKGGKRITSLNAQIFWKSNPKLSAISKRRGCYVFAIKAGKGMKPAYVGKATKSFKQEAFADHKLNKYTTAIQDQGKGTGNMFFICGSPKGKPNKKAIKEMEIFLIQIGLSKNKGLTNDKNTKRPIWGISGVVNNHKGQPSLGAKAFKKMMGL